MTPNPALAPNPALTTDMILVLIMIGIAVLLFIVEWVRVDVVAIIMMAVLPMLGLVTGAEAFSGLASNAVVSIIAIIIIGAGLDHTGVVNRAIQPIIALAGDSRPRIVGLISLAVAFISSVMQNIGAAALVLPALRRVSRSSKIPISRLLMPVGFSAILGGTITLVGSSPLILLNDLIAPYDLKPFELFDPLPIGVALVLAGVGYFLVFGKWILPDREEESRYEAGFDPTEAYPEVRSLFEVVMPHEPSYLPSVTSLCGNFKVHVVALSYDNGHTKYLPPDREKPINAGAVMAVYGTEKHVKSMADFYGMMVKPRLVIFARDLSSDIAGVVEAVVPPRSEFVGKSLSEILFRRHYLVTPLAVSRDDKTEYADLGHVVLRAGDAILMHGTWERFHDLRTRRNFIFTHPIDHEILHPQKALSAVACFALATALVLFTNLQLSVCLMAGALCMVLSKVLTMDEAYRAVDWRTVFLLAGLIPLGLATQKTGTAAWLAREAISLLGNPSPIVLYLMLGAVSTVFSLVISNVGAVVLLIPLVVNMAQDLGIDPRLASFVVALATSNSFVLPTHQVNALYMGPGRYTSQDFLKVGGGMSLVFLLVMTLMIWLFY
jgi:di/tricarboxylate transporter